MASLEERIQRIEDEAAIRELVARFAYTTTNVDYPGFSQLWVSEGNHKPLWVLSQPFEMSATGIREIVDMLHKLRDSRDFFVQMVHSGFVEVQGDHAIGHWILHEVAKGPGEVYYNNFSQYEDVMEKHGGKWFFAKRSYTYMFLDSEPFTGKVFQAPVTNPK